MGKNTQRVQDMLDGNYKSKIMVGEHSIKSSEHRKVGDKWTDSDGVTWEQKSGFKLPSKGLEPESEDEMMDKMELGLGYSFNVWKNLSIDPYYVMPVKENEAGERKGKFNLGLSYKF